MAANVKVRLFVFQNILHFWHVMAWIASNMGHVDIDVFHMEKQVFGILHAYDVVINVAVDGTQRFEVSQCIGSLDITDITSMPQLVNVFEEVEKLWH